MKGLGVAILAVVACLIVIVPASSAAVMPDHNGHNTFTANGITLTVQAKNTQISADGQTYGISWEIYMLNGTSQVLEQFGSYQVNRINNSAQNSVVKIVENSDVKAAEIYSFEGQSVDASIAVQSFLNGSVTFIVDFVMTMNFHQHVSAFGFSNQNFNFEFSTNKVIAPISANAWGLQDQYVSISWENEMPIFHSGVMEATLPYNTVSLPFGPFVLQTNETYDIDPVITPMIIPIPPGGGGGGGSGGTPPQLSSFYMDTNYASIVYVGNQIKMTANVYSLGSGGDTIKYYVVTAPYSQWVLIHQSGVSSTGPNDFTWTATGGSYLYFVVDLENGYGGMSESSGSAFVVLNNFPQSGNSYYAPGTYNTAPLKDSSGNILGYTTIVMSSVSDNFGQLSQSGSTFDAGFVAINSSVSSQSDFTYLGGINRYTQYFTWTGDSKGDSPSAVSWPAFLFKGFTYQAPQNDTWTLAEEMLWSALVAALTGIPGIGTAAIAAGIILAALEPLAFTNNPSGSSYQLTSNANNISVSCDLGNGGLFSVSWPVLRNSANQPVFMLEFNGQLSWYNGGQSISTSYTQDHPLVNYFGYGTTLWVTPMTYTTAPIACNVFEPIYIGEYYQ